MREYYIAIDLKSFYASVECMERGLDPLKTNLVVADNSRTEKTICLAVSPSLKSYGIPGRARLFEVIQKVKEVNAERRYQIQGRKFNGKSYDDDELKKHKDYEIDYIIAPPQMNKYMKYSTDIYGKSRLAELLTEISKIKEIKWIRFLYSYPETIDDELIKVVKENEKVCKYFDIPIQHISNNVLKRMNRKSNGEGIRKLIEKLRKEIPEVIIRTTVMVGFPGETTEDFDELYEFIQETKFDKMGAFSYSKEENTPAEKLKEQIHPATKKSRYNKIMQLQKELIEQKLKKYIGKKLEVLIENKTFDSKYYVARSYMEAPETDEVIYIKNTQELEIGQFTNCEITDVKEYDLIGKI